MPRGYNIQGGRPSSGSGGDAGGSYGEVSRGRAVVEVVVAILMGLIVTIYIYLLAHGHGNPTSLFSLALICEYGYVYTPGARLPSLFARACPVPLPHTSVKQVWVYVYFLKKTKHIQLLSQTETPFVRT